MTHTVITTRASATAAASRPAGVRSRGGLRQVLSRSRIVKDSSPQPGGAETGLRTV